MPEEETIKTNPDGTPIVPAEEAPVAAPEEAGEAKEAEAI